MRKNKIFFLALLLMGCATAVWAATTTVTNNGNITVRVQYKTPDGEYQDMYVKPGETTNLPGGIEKVKLVRDPGKWAEPKKPGEVIDIEVKEGDKVSGKMNWYGDKVFFEGLTEGLPPVMIGNIPSGNQPPPLKPESPKAEPGPPTPESKSEPVPSPAPPEKTEGGGGETPKQNWPWYGGVTDYLFFLQFFLLGMPFVFLLFRHWTRPKYYLDGEWIEESDLGWGWGWERGGGCGRYATMNGFFLGLALGGIALWGHSQFSPGFGFLQLFGQDLYSFPYFLLSQMHWAGAGMSDFIFVMLFWTLICTSFGALSGVIPLKWLYATPCFLAILPFFLFMRGCAGPHPFMYDGGYGGYELYPPAYSSFYSFPMILTFFLDWVDPYYEMDEEDEEDAGDALWDFLHGNPWPLLVFLTGGCVSCFYGFAYEYGWQTAIGEFFHDMPLSLGLGFISPYLMIFLFWMIFWGGLGWAFYSHPARFSLYACMIPAFLVLLFLTMGNYPERHLNFYRPLIQYEYRYNLPPISAVQKPDVFQDADSLRIGLNPRSYNALGRDLRFEERQSESQRRNDRY